MSGGTARLPHVAAMLARGAPLRIVAFGSSTTEGVGASRPPLAYPARLEAALAAALPSGAVRVLSRGIGGADAEVMARHVPEILAEHADLVVWQTGSNDMMNGVPPQRLAARARAGVVAMLQVGSDVLLVEPQFCPLLEGVPAAPAYRQALRALAAEVQIPLLRRYDLMRQAPDAAAMTGPDGMHLTDFGHAWLGRAVAREILAAAGCGQLMPERY
ncbi:MAG TPA: SGNH/GDSL hydrolase family protein [Candidatus Sulfotelmatobacter sp.]|nr:SGNH/GDSL hydrolase family protein [Candidatus Sulfotelmatobacter sp.]